MTGARAPIVLLHGLFGHLNDPAILGAFAGYRVHTPDLLGYGTLREASTDSLSLDDQAQCVIDYLAAHDLARVHLVGHSVGGAVAVCVAKRQIEAVMSLTSVEGNFVPSDAFWSAELARKPDVEVASMIDDLRRDPQAWMAEAGVSPSPWSSELGASWLANQPPSTIQAQARAVVEATNDPSYLATISDLIDDGMSINLVAGERSAGDWGVPQWVREAAAHDVTISGMGHLMMVESPRHFAEAVLDVTNHAG